MSGQRIGWVRQNVFRVEYRRRRGRRTLPARLHYIFVLERARKECGVVPVNSETDTGGENYTPRKIK